MYHTLPDEEQLAVAAADHIVEILKQALGSRERATFVLTGGETPKKTYEAIAERHGRTIDWKKVDFFWGDERFVPLDHEESNYGMARDALLTRLPASECMAYPFPTNLDSPETAAATHELTVQGYFGEAVPRFDLMLLGLGADGHVGSLFPGRPELDENRRLIISTEAPDDMPIRQRLTMTFPLLNAGRKTIFLVAGDQKAEAVAKAQRGDDIPASRIKPDGELIWYLDEAAAADLQR